MELQMCFGQRIEQGAVLGPQMPCLASTSASDSPVDPVQAPKARTNWSRVTIPFCKAINPNSRSRDAAWRCGMSRPPAPITAVGQAPALADHPGRAHASRPTFYDKRILGREQ